MLSDIGASDILVPLKLTNGYFFLKWFFFVFFFSLQSKNLGNGNVSFEDFVSLMYAISIIAEIADDPQSECEESVKKTLTVN